MSERLAIETVLVTAAPRGSRMSFDVPTLEGSRAIAREEVASLCGLVLRRLQEEAQASIDGSATEVHILDLEQIFGEALRDFGGTTDQPGEPA